MRWACLIAALAFVACGSSTAGGEGDGGTIGTGGGGTGGGSHGDGGTGGGTTDGGTGHTGPWRWPPARNGYVSPIAAENALPGDPNWQKGYQKPWAAQIEAYANRVSAQAGDTVQLMVRSDTAMSVSWTLYRLGWYGGAEARALTSGTTAVGAQPACANNHTTGLVSCSWSPTFSVTIPSNAVSGLYLVRILRPDKIGILIPVVVKDDRPADLYFQSSVTTAQAYNAWGGESLYEDDGDSLGHFAVQVSFDRPYDSDFGSGQVLRYEALMAAFLERNGYDVSYTTNLDVAREGSSALLKRGAFLSVGHDEYWPGEERDAVEAARDAGQPVFFFGANAAYWKVRLSNPGADGNARLITCYKQHPEQDPLAGTPAQTGRFRDPPINRPEEELVGTMYESWLLFGQPFVVADASDPIFAGTNMHNGDIIPQLVGYEYDRTFLHDTPSPVKVFARSQLVDAESKPGLSEATYYVAPGGAFVFGAGSIYWSRGVDGPLRDGRVERMTANALQMGTGLPVPSSLLAVNTTQGVPPDGNWANSVRTVATGMAGPAGVAQLPDGSFVVADARGMRIWRVDASGNVTPYAGDGNPDGDPRFDNVAGLNARFFQPTAVLADKLGNVYVADTHNCAIRKIANDAYHTVTTIAGSLMAAAYADGVGSAARFNDPMGMAWFDATHIVIADSANQAIRVLDLTTAKVTTLAITHWGDDLDGPASVATFYYPTAVAVAPAPDNRVFFLASSTGKVKVIGNDTAHTVTTLTTGGLGFADGSGTTARLQPQGGLLWWNSALLVSDSANQRLRLLTPGTDAASTRVQTWAGSGQMGEADGSARSASFSVPLGMTAGSDGRIYVVDGAGTLRAVQP